MNPMGNPNMQVGKPSVNPLGRPAKLFQSFTDRLAWWLENHTGDEIQAVVRNKKEWGKLSAIDQIVIRRIQAATQKHKSTADFIAVLDRLVGKPVQPIAATFDMRHGLAERIEAARRRLASDPQAVIEQSSVVTVEDAKITEGNLSTD